MVHWKAPQPLLSLVSAPPQLWVPIAEDTISNAATYDLTWAEDVALLTVRISQFRPATDGVQLLGRTSGDGGLTWDSGASDYTWQCIGRGISWGINNSASGSGSGGSRLRFNPASAGTDVSNAEGYGMTGNFYLFNPSAAKQTNVLGEGVHRYNVGGLSMAWQSQGTRTSSARVNGFQLYFHTGNITSGRVQALGLLAHGAGS